MNNNIRDDQYLALADLRYRIRLFLQSSDTSAQQQGIEPQQYQMMLAIRAIDAPEHCTIRTLADRLLLKHHSVVELVDRMEAKQLVSRTRSQQDRREVFVQLRPKGQRLLEKIVRQRLVDLRSNGRAFVKALNAVLNSADKHAR
jgi:DNA-binding MarR family transcriptional regulator